MVRRILSLMLLPCMLLNQAVAYGHAHGGKEPFGHGHRHHFHMNSFDLHDHDDHLAPGGQFHSHHGGASEVGDPVLEPGIPSDHDSDAVYVNSVVALARLRSAINPEWMVSLDWASSRSYLHASLVEGPSPTVFRWTHAPPLAGYTCPLYLRQLTLLI